VKRRTRRSTERPTSVQNRSTVVRLIWLLRQERASSRSGTPGPVNTDHEPSRERRSVSSRTPWALPHRTTIVTAGHVVESLESTVMGIFSDEPYMIAPTVDGDDTQS
jgi:hypothetical protein